MKEIRNKLEQYEFFKGKNLELFSIQDYGRKSKFKIKMEDKYYTLLLTEDRILPYINKINILGSKFKKIIGFKYLSEDNKILVLDYFGNNKGIDLIKINDNIETENYDIQLKNIIDSIHNNKHEYIDFSNNFKSWKEYYLLEIKTKIINIYNSHLITEEIKNILLEKLEKSAEVYTNFETTFIHGDITPLNVCIDKDNSLLYLIDFDDFKIGDPLMDISRIINCQDMSKIFKLLVDKYYKKYEHNINHLFYTLRVNVNWYNHIIEKHQENIYDLEKAKEEIFNVVSEIIQY